MNMIETFDNCIVYIYERFPIIVEEWKKAYIIVVIVLHDTECITEMIRWIWLEGSEKELMQTINRGVGQMTASIMFKILSIFLLL